MAEEILTDFFDQIRTVAPNSQLRLGYIREDDSIPPVAPRPGYQTGHGQ